MMKQSCNKIMPCGHPCKGFRGEAKCIGCLDETCIKNHNLALPHDKRLESMNGESYCGICQLSGLGDEPSIILGCGHIFHVNCILRIVSKRWPSPRMTFDFLNCPHCKQLMTFPNPHPEIEQHYSWLIGKK